MLRHLFEKAARRNELAGGEPLLIVGLGNPGRQYARTWHNCGFMVLEILAERHQIPIRKIKFKSIMGQGQVAGQKCLLQMPTTYMNRSGEAIRALIDFYKVPLSRCLVVYDDIDLPVGTIRIRPSGGPGTHNGMRSIVDHVGGTDFPRLRIGIGPKPLHMDMADYVLANVPESQQAQFERVIKQAADAAELWLEKGTEKAMAEFNRKPID